MENNLDTTHFLDLLSDLAQQIESRGARTVLREFATFYPEHYGEIKAQIERGFRQEAVLLKKNADPV